MISRSNQNGFTVFEIIIVLVVIGIIGLAGYLFYDRQAGTDQAVTNETSQSATENDVPEAPEITSTSDLDEAAMILDDTDAGLSNDSAELDSELQAF